MKRVTFTLEGYNPMPATIPESGTRISIVCGIIVDRDAISNICMHHLQAIDRFAARHGRHYPTQVYANGTDRPDHRIRCIADPVGLARDPHFSTSDLVLYQFGIYYSLFDSIHLAPRNARLAVSYFGITPPSCVPTAARSLIYKSYEQSVNIHACDSVITGSRYLHRELVEIGIPREKIHHNPYCVPFDADLPEVSKSRSQEYLRLLYVGRFSPAKGLLDLVSALKRFRKAHPNVRLEVRLVGSRRFSEAAFLDRLNSELASENLREIVATHYDVSTEELQGHLAWADVLVIPSYHEGFCVPVIEAMMAGCFVVCSDAGALPETSGGLGQIFKTGNADDLVRCLSLYVDMWFERGIVPTHRGCFTEEEHREAVIEHLAKFSRNRFEDTFTRLLFDGMTRLPDQARAGLLNRRSDLLDAFRSAQGSTPTQDGLQRHLRSVVAAGYSHRHGYGKFACRDSK